MNKAAFLRILRDGLAGLPGPLCILPAQQIMFYAKGRFIVPKFTANRAGAGNTGVYFQQPGLVPVFSELKIGRSFGFYIVGDQDGGFFQNGVFFDNERLAGSPFLG